jgi:hypothetical protein
MAGIHRTGGTAMEELGLSPLDEHFLLAPPPVSGAKKRRQEQIHRTKPWEISAIARSQPMKQLKAKYLELYYEIHPEEKPK